MSNYIANPTSRKKIRDLAKIFRTTVGMYDAKCFPIVEFLELGLPQLYPDFSYEIASVDEMETEYGLTLPEKNQIILREDVYERALAGNGRDRFTVAHEIGHFIMHKPGSIALARSTSQQEIPKFKDPEWQANTFAGELLAPLHVIRGFSVEEVSMHCKVSKTVAAIQLRSL